MTELNLSPQVGFVIMVGTGMGLMLGQASTDAVNRVSRLAYGEATGITQTVRNFAASLGIAVLSTILVDQSQSRVTASLTALGVPPARAAAQALAIKQSQDANRRSRPMRMPKIGRVGVAAIICVNAPCVRFSQCYRRALFGGIRLVPYLCLVVLS